MSALPIIQPGQLEAPLGDIPELRLPAPDLFIDRSRRLLHLADGHSLGDFLRFAAHLAELQHQLMQRLPALPGPEGTLLAQCRAHAMPPLAPAGWRRDPVWRGVARELAQDAAKWLPAAARPAMERLARESDTWLEAQAEALLDQQPDELDLACAPLLGAALQVYWTALARRLTPEDVARPEHPSVCPVCGSHPVAAVVRIGGAENGLRYLHCSLCGSEWHVVRAKCSNCENTRDIGYYGLEGDSGAVRAETCPECHTYLKVVRQDKDPHVDPLADDLASLALDLLVSEQGFGRSGRNYLLIHGGAEA